MPLLSQLVHTSRRLIGAAALASLTGGVCSVLLVATINNAIAASAAARQSLLLQFIGLAVLMVVARIFAGVLFSRLSQSTVAELRMLISQKLINAPYRHIEQLGSARVHSLLTDDANNVATFFVSVPVLIMNAAIVIGCFAYLASLSWLVFALTCAVAVVGAVIYHFSHLRVFHHLQTASRRQDELFSNLGALVAGAKELRLNRSRARAFMSEVLRESVNAVRDHRVRGLSLYAVSASWGYFLFFALIGVVVFLLADALTSDTRVATGYAIVFLYLMVPLEVLINSIPLLNLARVCLGRIESATRDMKPTEKPDSVPQASSLSSLELRAVTHTYYHEREDGLFKLGPIDLSFRPGEICFLIGGNGSGKTTLAKILVGLYAPETGATVMNGSVITDHSRAGYRQLFSAIFTDFYLFESLAGIEASHLDARANELLERFHLNHKVSVTGGRFSTRDLSQGQRKRLTLIAAYLEDRPFFVFDEWAADQDPQFREVFYHSVLPDLKSRGKAVLVISHDERYFHVADRVIRMENGQLLDRAPKPVRSLLSAATSAGTASP